MNICNPAIILILSASRPYSHATQDQFPLISLSRLTPDAAQATAEAHGCASSGAAGGTQCPSSRPRICHLCYHIVFSVLPFVLSDICRTEDHKPRGRASDVSTISTCLSYMSWFTAHSPTDLCEKGWGYHCCVLVWLLALFAKLNRFFRKKKVVVKRFMTTLLA